MDKVLNLVSYAEKKYPIIFDFINNFLITLCNEIDDKSKKVKIDNNNKNIFYYNNLKKK